MIAGKRARICSAPISLSVRYSGTSIVSTTAAAFPPTQSTNTVKRTRSSLIDLRAARVRERRDQRGRDRARPDRGWLPDHL